MISLWLLTPWQLGVILSVLPSSNFPGDYPPLSPDPSVRFRPPGVPFGFVFPVAMFFLAIANVALTMTAARAGVKWGLDGVLAMTVVWLGAATALGFALRTRPELEMDKERREITWRPNAVWSKPVVLPFAAIVDIRVELKSGRGFYAPVITWRTNKGAARTTWLPMGADRKRVEEVVARLRTGTYGTTAAQYRVD
ncbi:hypothetical protein C1280_33790 [Gemmata obscuriglobus]|uniref:Uncharacterized protein n=1 Tax=Gemmata obscuriglobus TaxID=114 RepID=A0A2Z3HEW4_9BACT|nr:hypothetical protein C1280_33790 [Gemmata obscuriglobus]